MSASSTDTAVDPKPYHLNNYLKLVSEYWEKDGTCCTNCDLYDGPGRCGMLHDGTIPEGDCAGLIASLGLKQP